MLLTAQTSLGALRGILQDAYAFAQRDPRMFLIIFGTIVFLLPRLVKTYLTYRYDRLPPEHPAKAKRKPTYTITDMPKHLAEWLPYALLLAGVWFITR